MATTRKVLGQAAPAANTDTDLYTVPASTSTVCSTLSVCNRGATSATFRVAVRPAGATLANAHYLYYGVQLATGDSFAATIGLTLAATDVVTVRASTADLSFSLFGEETS
jgi:hypothetical protein